MAKAKIALITGETREVTMHIPDDGSFLGVNHERGVGWSVTHLPTGLRAYPASFGTKQEALKALSALEPLHAAWAGAYPKATEAVEPLLLKASERLGHTLVRLQ
jgi:hypothetical protein